MESWYDFGISHRCSKQVLGFSSAGLNETALFSCEAHNSKGLTASNPGQVNVKGKGDHGVTFTC